MAQDVETLVKDLNHPWDWTVRNEAVRRVEVRHETAAVPDLSRVITEDESPFVRASAARALGKLGSGEGVPALVQALHDEAFHVRQAAMWALGEIGAAAAPAVEALRPFTASIERFPQAELTVAQVAEIVVGRIEAAIEQAQAAPAEATEAAPTAAGTLSAEERKAKREAALARKRAREAGVEIAAPATAQAETPADQAPPAGSAGRILTPEERQAKREAALARKRALEAERKQQDG